MGGSGFYVVFYIVGMIKVVYFFDVVYGVGKGVQYNIFGSDIFVLVEVYVVQKRRWSNVGGCKEGIIGLDEGIESKYFF